MDDAVDRAAEIIGQHTNFGKRITTGAAQALADDGLLVTEEIRAIEVSAGTDLSVMAWVNRHGKDSNCIADSEGTYSGTLSLGVIIDGYLTTREATP